MSERNLSFTLQESIQIFYQYGNLLGRSDSASLFKNNTWFFTHCQEAIDKLKLDLNFSLDQSIDRESRQLSLDKKLKATSDLLITAADGWCEELAIVIPKKKQKITVKGPVIDAILQSINLDNYYELIQPLDECERMFYRFSSFESRRVVFSCMQFFSSLKTLMASSERNWLDSVIEKATCKHGYFANGYPHDLLFSDVYAAKKDSGEDEIYLKANYCSTAWDARDGYVSHRDFR